MKKIISVFLFLLLLLNADSIAIVSVRKPVNLPSASPREIFQHKFQNTIQEARKNYAQKKSDLENVYQEKLNDLKQRKIIGENETATAVLEQKGFNKEITGELKDLQEAEKILLKNRTLDEYENIWLQKDAAPEPKSDEEKQAFSNYYQLLRERYYEPIKEIIAEKQVKTERDILKKLVERNQTDPIAKKLLSMKIVIEKLQINKPPKRGYALVDKVDGFMMDRRRIDSILDYFKKLKNISELQTENGLKTIESNLIEFTRLIDSATKNDMKEMKSWLKNLSDINNYLLKNKKLTTEQYEQRKKIFEKTLSELPETTTTQTIKTQKKIEEPVKQPVTPLFFEPSSTPQGEVLEPAGKSESFDKDFFAKEFVIPTEEKMKELTHDQRIEFLEKFNDAYADLLKELGTKENEYTGTALTASERLYLTKENTLNALFKKATEEFTQSRSPGGLKYDRDKIAKLKRAVEIINKKALYYFE